MIVYTLFLDLSMVFWGIFKEKVCGNIRKSIDKSIGKMYY